jgi:hypothetical protein
LKFIHSFILYSTYTSLRWWWCQPRVWWNASFLPQT